MKRKLEALPKLTDAEKKVKLTTELPDEKELRCPITKNFFSDPVIAPDGKTYERSALVAIFDKQRQKWLDAGNKLEDFKVKKNNYLFDDRIVPDNLKKMAVQRYVDEITNHESDSVAKGITCSVLLQIEQARLHFKKAAPRNPIACIYLLIVECFLVPKDRMNNMRLEYTRIKSLFNLLETQKNAQIQCAIGLCYYLGLLVHENHAKAMQFFRLAAEQRDAASQFNLGMCYKEGKGVEKNVAEAAQLFKLAAEQGYMKAQFNLALAYELGEGVTQDKKEARRLYHLAASQGDRIAQYNLGYFYSKGIVIEQNIKEAVRLYQLAALQGHTMAVEAYRDICSELKNPGFFTQLHDRTYNSAATETNSENKNTRQP